MAAKKRLKGQKETEYSKRGRTANNSRIPPSFSTESKTAEKLRPGKQNHRARERLRKRPLRDGSVETNEISHNGSLRSRKEKQSNFWAGKDRAEGRVEEKEVEAGETDARVGGGVEDAELSASLKAIITSPDSSPSATPPTPTSSLPPKVKPASNGKRSQKAKAKQTHRANEYLPSKTTLSPKTKSQFSSDAAKSKRPSVKQPTQLVAALGSGSPSREDPVHRLKPKSLKKLSGSLLSEVWKDERGGGGQLKGGKKGEKREIGILAEQERNRKKGGGGLRPTGGTRTISKTTSDQQTTNKHFGVTTPGEVFIAPKSALTGKSREIDEETSRVVAKLISQSGRGLEERSRGRHSLHRTTSTPHPYQYNHPPTSSTQTSYIPYIPYTPEPDPAFFRTSSTTTRRPASTAATTVQPVMPFSINSIRTGDYVEKTAGLETIPFSRCEG